MSYTKHFSFFSFVINIRSWFNSPFRDWIFQTCRASFQPLMRIPHGMTQHGGELERERALYQEKGPHGYPTVREEFKNLVGFITPCLSRTRPWKNCISSPPPPPIYLNILYQPASLCPVTMEIKPLSMNRQRTQSHHSKGSLLGSLAKDWYFNATIGLVIIFPFNIYYKLPDNVFLLHFRNIFCK